MLHISVGEQLPPAEVPVLGGFYDMNKGSFVPSIRVPLVDGGDGDDNDPEAFAMDQIVEEDHQRRTDSYWTFGQDFTSSVSGLNVDGRIALSFLSGLLSLRAGIGIGHDNNTEHVASTASRTTRIATHQRRLDLTKLLGLREALLYAKNTCSATHLVVNVTHGHYMNLNLKFNRKSTKVSNRIAFSGGGSIDLIVASASVDAGVEMKFSNIKNDVTFDVSVNASCTSIGVLLPPSSLFTPKQWPTPGAAHSDVVADNDFAKIYDLCATFMNDAVESFELVRGNAVVGFALAPIETLLAALEVGGTIDAQSEGGAVNRSRSIAAAMELVQHISALQNRMAHLSADIFLPAFPELRNWIVSLETVVANAASDAMAMVRRLLPFVLTASSSAVAGTLLSPLLATAAGDEAAAAVASSDDGSINAYVAQSMRTIAGHSLRCYQLTHQLVASTLFADACQDSGVKVDMQLSGDVVGAVFSSAVVTLSSTPTLVAVVRFSTAGCPGGGVEEVDEAAGGCADTACVDVLSYRLISLMRRVATIRRATRMSQLPLKDATGALGFGGDNHCYVLDAGCFGAAHANPLLGNSTTCNDDCTSLVGLYVCAGGGLQRVSPSDIEALDVAASAQTATSCQACISAVLAGAATVDDDGQVDDGSSGPTSQLFLETIDVVFTPGSFGDAALLPVGTPSNYLSVIEFDGVDGGGSDPPAKDSLGQLCLGAAFSTWFVPRYTTSVSRAASSVSVLRDDASSVAGLSTFWIPPPSQADPGRDPPEPIWRAAAFEIAQPAPADVRGSVLVVTDVMMVRTSVGGNNAVASLGQSTRRLSLLPLCDTLTLCIQRERLVLGH